MNTKQIFILSFGIFLAVFAAQGLAPQLDRFVTKRLAEREIERQMEAKAPCAADQTRLCSEVDPTDIAKVRACLVENQSRLSPTCYNIEVQPMVDALNPCESEIRRFCSGILYGGGKIKACLKENVAELSPACKTKIQL